MQKLLILLTLISTITFTAVGQEAPEKQKILRPRIELGVHISPMVAHRFVNIGGVSSGYTGSVLDKPMPSYSAGISSSFNVGRHVGLQIGVSYVRMGYETEWHRYNDHTAYRDEFGMGKSRDVYNYVDIPLRLNIYAGSGKVRFVGAIGGHINALVQTRSTTITAPDFGEYQRIETFVSGPKNMRRFNFSPLVVAGIDIHLGHRIAFRCEPYFHFTSFPYTSISGNGRYFWASGLNLAFYYGVYH